MSLLANTGRIPERRPSACGPSLLGILCGYHSLGLHCCGGRIPCLWTLAGGTCFCCGGCYIFCNIPVCLLLVAEGGGKGIISFPSSVLLITGSVSEINKGSHGEAILVPHLTSGETKRTASPCIAGTHGRCIQHRSPPKETTLKCNTCPKPDAHRGPKNEFDESSLLFPGRVLPTLPVPLSLYNQP